MNSVWLMLSWRRPNLDPMELTQKIKSRSGAGLTALLLFGLGVLVGRFTTPAKIEERVRVQTQVQNQIQIEYRDKIVTKTVYVQAQNQKTRREEHEVIKPDGTVERSSVETAQTETQVSNVAEQQIDTQLLAQQQVHIDMKSESTRVVAVQPDWTIAVLAGVSPHADFMPPVGPPPLVIGVHVQYRALGPIKIGAWALTSPAVGVSIASDL